MHMQATREYGPEINCPPTFVKAESGRDRKPMVRNLHDSGRSRPEIGAKHSLDLAQPVDKLRARFDFILGE
jgi:hypothetical protein